ncbi:hypothetical protein K474DRAFT_1670235 [Panus rudis PR-1116 ss-1]|nr:hypothetical protein K474DRAFT_1670235 [Panus rudis PR-1116 ss-1]
MRHSVSLLYAVAIMSAIASSQVFATPLRVNADNKPSAQDIMPRTVTSLEEGFAPSLDNAQQQPVNINIKRGMELYSKQVAKNEQRRKEEQKNSQPQQPVQGSGSRRQQEQRRMREQRLQVMEGVLNSAMQDMPQWREQMAALPPRGSGGNLNVPPLRNGGQNGNGLTPPTNTQARTNGNIFAPAPMTNGNTAPPQLNGGHRTNGQNGYSSTAGGRGGGGGVPGGYSTSTGGRRL